MAIEIYALVVFEIGTEFKKDKLRRMQTVDEEAARRYKGSMVREIEYRFCRLKLVQPPICTRKRNGILRTTVPLPKWEVVEELKTISENKPLRSVELHKLLHYLELDVPDRPYLLTEREVDDRRITTEQMGILFPETKDMPKLIALDYIREKMES